MRVRARDQRPEVIWRHTGSPRTVQLSQSGCLHGFGWASLISWGTLPLRWGVASLIPLLCTRSNGSKGSPWESQGTWGKSFSSRGCRIDEDRYRSLPTGLSRVGECGGMGRGGGDYTNWGLAQKKKLRLWIQGTECLSKFRMLIQATQRKSKFPNANPSP